MQSKVSSFINMADEEPSELDAKLEANLYIFEKWQEEHPRRIPVGYDEYEAGVNKLSYDQLLLMARYIERITI